MKIFSLSSEERFWAQVRIGPQCWEWLGYRREDGYGDFGLDGNAIRAHRFSYMTTRGDIPSGYEINHLCRNRCCVKPDHLEVTTRRENLRYSSPMTGTGAGDFQASKTHCPQGHPYNGQNLIVQTFRKRGALHNMRIYRTCNNRRNLERWRELRRRQLSGQS